MGLYAQIDCSFPDRADVAEVGDIAELIYIRAVLRCREHLTDGVIDRRLLSRWFTGVRGKPQAHLQKLVEVGLLETHPQGWQIPPGVWVKWNPTKADVQDKREIEAERKREYREKKRQEKEAKVSRAGPTGTSADVPDVSRAASEVRPRQPESKPKPKSKPEYLIAPKPRERNLIWDALVQHVGDVTTKPEQSRRAKVVSDLKAAQATPEQIAQRCREYRQRWPKMDLTDTALVNHWSKLETQGGPKPRADGLIVTGAI